MIKILTKTFNRNNKNTQTTYKKIMIVKIKVKLTEIENLELYNLSR